MNQRHDDEIEPCFITDGPPFDELPSPPYRIMSLPQILAGLTDKALVTWTGDFAGAERQRRKTRG